MFYFIASIYFILKSTWSVCAYIILYYNRKTDIFTVLVLMFFNVVYLHDTAADLLGNILVSTMGWRMVTG